MEEIKNQEVQNQETVVDQERLDQMNQVVKQVIAENKKRGSITTDALFDKLDKFQATASELEEIYKTFDDNGIQIVNEYERDKDLYDQLM